VELTGRENWLRGLVSGISAKCAGLRSGPRSVYQVVLRSFALTGRAPAPDALEAAAAQVGLTGDRRFSRRHGDLES
jgi:hypothetical protein